MRKQEVELSEKVRQVFSSRYKELNNNDVAEIMNNLLGFAQTLIKIQEGLNIRTSSPKDYCNPYTQGIKLNKED